jgi:hypothetical protein
MIPPIQLATISMHNSINSISNYFMTKYHQFDFIISLYFKTQNRQFNFMSQHNSIYSIIILGHKESIQLHISHIFLEIISSIQLLTSHHFRRLASLHFRTSSITRHDTINWICKSNHQILQPLLLRHHTIILSYYRIKNHICSNIFSFFHSITFSI